MIILADILTNEKLALLFTACLSLQTVWTQIRTDITNIESKKLFGHSDSVPEKRSAEKSYSACRVKPLFCLDSYFINVK